MNTCRGCQGELNRDDIRCPKCMKCVTTRLYESIDCYYERASVSNSDNEVYRKRETFREKVQLLLPRVESIAREGRTAQYPDVWGNGVDIYGMKYYLGAICDVEYRDGRPLLSAVIINAEHERPSDGFFELVETFPDHPDNFSTWTETEKQRWWKSECDRVHQYWTSIDSA